MTTFTQAEREAKAKLFASASQIRLTIPPNPDYGEMYRDHVIFGVTELAKVVAMIRGEQPAALVPVSPFPAAQCETGK